MLYIFVSANCISLSLLYLSVCEGRGDQTWDKSSHAHFIKKKKSISSYHRCCHYAILGPPSLLLKKNTLPTAYSVNPAVSSEKPAFSLFHHASLSVWLVFSFELTDRSMALIPLPHCAHLSVHRQESGGWRGWPILIFTQTHCVPSTPLMPSLL